MFSTIIFQNYKSFSSDKPVEISGLKHVNIIIGKNNCGKSSILDIINAATDSEYQAVNSTRISNIELGFIIS